MVINTFYTACALSIRSALFYVLEYYSFDAGAPVPTWLAAVLATEAGDLQWTEPSSDGSGVGAGLQGWELDCHVTIGREAADLCGNAHAVMLQGHSALCF